MLLYVCIYHIFTHSSVDRPLGCSLVLAIVNSAAEHRGACIFLDYSFVWIYTQEWDPGSYGPSICSFSRNNQTVCVSGCTSLHSHQQCRMQEAFLFSTFCPALVVCILAIVNNVSMNIGVNISFSN